MRRILVFVCLFVFASSHAQGLRWTKDGNGFFTIEGGAIVKNELPSFTKTVLVSKEMLTPAGASSALTVRDFTFSADDRKLLIYTNTKRVWRQDSKGDYWVLDLDTKKLAQIGKSKPASSLMFAKFSPDGKKVSKKVELFTWEKLDYVSKVKKAFGLK